MHPIIRSALPLLAAAFLHGQNNITVYPGPATIAKGTSRQMSAYVPLSPNTVTWAINDVVGGNSTYGTVTSNGLYTAPPVVPANNLITIKVASTAYPAKIGTAQVTITQPQTNVWSVYPTTFAAGPVSLTVNGSNFVQGAVVTINNQPLATVFVSSVKLTVVDNVPASMAGMAQIRAVNPAPGATTSTPVNVTVKTSSVNVTVAPSNPTMAIKGTLQFSATVTGSMNTGVTWSASNGTITSGGLYTAPNTLPSPATAVVTATSMADPLVSASSTVTLTAPTTTITLSPTSVQLQTGATQQFTATVSNSANTNVTWTVNGTAGGNSTYGTISAAGLYTAPAVIPAAPNVTVRATSVGTPTVFANAAVTVKATPPPTVNLSHARFLEQAAYGPSPADLASIGQLGINGWLNAQLAMSETFIPVPAATSDAQQQYLSRLVHAPDQLRQRMVNALAKIIVISTNKNIYPNEFVPYWQILSKNAFGNYRQLMWEITTSSQMGKYLDLAKSAKPGVGSGSNENYAREVMQLFTIGLVALNPDGTTQLDPQGKTIPTYNQAVVAQTALAFTGWVYPGNQWESFTGPMQAMESNHDTTAKTLVNGCPSPAGQTVAQETNTVLDCLFNHPNTAPFIVTRLIKDIVESNPSPAYVQRVVNVWNNNGVGVKGDLKAVLTAILTDSEARQDAAGPTQGRLKDAIYYIASFLRAMNGSLAQANYETWPFTQMGMAPMGPPSVFGFYPMLFRIPAYGLAGPEFQIYSPTESVLRGNMVYNMLTNPNQSDMKIDLSPYTAVASDVSALIETVNSRLLYGRMTPTFKNSLTTAVNAAYDNNQRVQTALYLTALSGQYAVQY